MAYRIVKLDLSAFSSDPVELVPPNQPMAEVVILSVPFGVEFQLGFGNNPLMTIDRPMSFEPVGDEDTSRGLFGAVPVAAPGVKIEILVGSVPQAAGGA